MSGFILYSLLQIQDATSETELQELLGSTEYDFRYDLGIVKPVAKLRLADRDSIVSSMALHYGVLSVKADFVWPVGNIECPESD